MREGHFIRTYRSIDFDLLLCENPRKRPLLRGNSGGGSATVFPGRRFLKRHTMDLFQYHFPYQGPNSAGSSERKSEPPSADLAGLRRI